MRTYAILASPSRLWIKNFPICGDPGPARALLLASQRFPHPAFARRRAGIVLHAKGRPADDMGLRFARMIVRRFRGEERCVFFRPGSSCLPAPASGPLADGGAGSVVGSKQLRVAWTNAALMSQQTNQENAMNNLEFPSRLRLLAAAMLLGGLSVGAAMAADIKVTLSGANEVPPVTTSAAGSGTIMVARRRVGLRQRQLDRRRRHRRAHPRSRRRQERPRDRAADEGRRHLQGARWRQAHRSADGEPQVRQPVRQRAQRRQSRRRNSRAAEVSTAGTLPGTLIDECAEW